MENVCSTPLTYMTVPATCCYVVPIPSSIDNFFSPLVCLATGKCLNRGITAISEKRKYPNASALDRSNYQAFHTYTASKTGGSV